MQSVYRAQAVPLICLHCPSLVPSVTSYLQPHSFVLLCPNPTNLTFVVLPGRRRAAECGAWPWGVMASDPMAPHWVMASDPVACQYRVQKVTACQCSYVMPAWPCCESAHRQVSGVHLMVTPSLLGIVMLNMPRFMACVSTQGCDLPPLVCSKEELICRLIPSP